MKKRAILVIMVTAGILFSLLIIVWLGLQVKPRCFSGFDTDFNRIDAETQYESLPPEMNNYFEKIFSEGVYQMKNSIVHGRASIRIKGIRVPVRFITFYKPSYGFFRYMEITWFGIPIISGYDIYTDDSAEFNIGGNLETGEKIEQGQNMALWAESVWSPAAYLQDERLEWLEPDEYGIGLSIPFKDSTDHIAFDMDPETGLISSMEAYRYKGQRDEKQLWTIECLEWEYFNGVLIPVKSSVKWGDENKPWAFWNVEGVIYNTEMSDDFEEESSWFLE